MLTETKEAESCPAATVDADTVLRCALDLAGATLKCGGGIQRVEDTVTRVCRAYGAVHVEVFAIISMITAAVRMPDGSYSSQVRRIGRSGTDLGRLEKLNALSREVCREGMDPEILQEKLRQIKEQHNYPYFVILLASFLTAGGFAVFFGGSFADGAFSGLIAVLMALFSRFCLKFANEISKPLLSALLGGLLACGTAKLLPFLHADILMIGTVMLLIPGLALGTSLRDLLCDDTLSGILRLCRSVLSAVMIALGYAAGIFLSGEGAEFSLSLAANPFVMILTGTVGAIGMALSFHVLPRRLIPAAVCSIAACAVYLGMSALTGFEFLRNLIAAATVAALAEIFARVQKKPAPIFYTPGLLPLAPGGCLYYTMYSVIFGLWDNAWQLGLRTLEIGLGIAAGRVAISMIVMIVNDAKARWKKRAA